MGQTALLVKVVGSNKNGEWIYHFGANPGLAVGRLPATLSGLGPGSALRSRPRVALSSAQAFSAYITGPWLVHSPFLGLGSSPCVGRRQLVPPCGPDCLSATGELIRRSYVRDGAVQADRVVLFSSTKPTAQQAARSTTLGTLGSANRCSSWRVSSAATARCHGADVTATRAVALWNCPSGCWTARPVAACDWQTCLSCGPQT